jgi:D-alanyl-D-alanine endopeptidase (penicillin-binding protein 7)
VQKEPAIERPSRQQAQGFGLSRRLLSAILSILLIGSLFAAAAPVQASERSSKTAAEPRKKAATRTAQPRKTPAQARTKAVETRRTAQARTPARVTARVRATAPARAGARAVRREATARPSRVAAAQRPRSAARATARPVRPAPSLARKGTSSVAVASAAAAGVASGAVLPIAHIRSLQPSDEQPIGLHEGYDRLALRSSAALMLDAKSGQVLFEKNASAVVPIASITKLMTAIVVLDAGLPLDEPLTISKADFDRERFTGSRLRAGTVLTRDEMLNLALMSSENRAASALGRHYPGGLKAFVARMNAKARELGMTSTRFVEPTGLSSSNVSNAYDLARLVRAASRYPLIRAHSTSGSLTVASGTRAVSFRNSNRLVHKPDWDIGLQKTGYIREAGNCLVMQASIEGRPMVLVLLDADNKLSRFGDARRLRDWFESSPPFTGGTHASAQSSRGS